MPCSISSRGNAVKQDHAKIKQKRQAITSFSTCKHHQTKKLFYSSINLFSIVHPYPQQSMPFLMGVKGREQDTMMLIIVTIKQLLKCMEITFYKKAHPPLQTISSRKPQPSSKRSSQLESTSSFRKKSERGNSEPSFEKECESLEGVTQPYSSVLYRKQHQREGRNITEMSEGCPGLRRKNFNSQSIRIIMKQKREETKRQIIPKQMVPTCRGHPSQPSINNSLIILSKLRRLHKRNSTDASQMPQGGTSLLFPTKPIISLDSSPHKARPVQHVEPPKARGKVYSYHCPQLQVIKTRQLKLKQVLQKFGPSPDLKDSFVQCLKNATRK